MFEIGRINSLKVKNIEDSGAWLASELGPVLLPARECPSGLNPEDRIDVFIYRDTADSLIATLQVPKAQVGDFALLPVKQVGPHGAFLD